MPNTSRCQFIMSVLIITSNTYEIVCLFIRTHRTREHTTLLLCHIAEIHNTTKSMIVCRWLCCTTQCFTLFYGILSDSNVLFRPNGTAPTTDIFITTIFSLWISCVTMCQTNMRCDIHTRYWQPAKIEERMRRATASEKKVKHTWNRMRCWRYLLTEESLCTSLMLSPLLWTDVDVAFMQKQKYVFFQSVSSSSLAVIDDCHILLWHKMCYAVVHMTRKSIQTLHIHSMVVWCVVDDDSGARVLAWWTICPSHHTQPSTMHLSVGGVLCRMVNAQRQQPLHTAEKRGNWISDKTIEFRIQI